MSRSDGDPSPAVPDFERRVPPGDSVVRDVCARCGFVAYENPKIVVGSVVRVGEKVLLCRRAIEPSHGLWTLPAGFMELGETPEGGARREAREEALAEIEIRDLLAVYTIPRISQVQLIYRAGLSGGFAPGEESLEVALFAPDEIPWAELAFASVHWALTQEARWHAGEATGPFVNPPEGL
ncbi:NUDIX hydrolase [Methylobrevis pamukkalensis]|uniref:NADH pyrophosphatase n=1 Tax=Methylobrevis pamukkalensis TaxID=1439726 RepID=A0A1E3H850_9HYPH|nr:NUDIX hydrolase [Methylobrevis pamukkalensis]ODN72519.1 NADH pyrophosphatase [Methylobrevis pamukkalensis]